MITYLAQFYVNIVEPAFKVFLVVVIIAFLLYGFNLVRGVETKNGLVGGVVNGVVKLTIKTIQLSGKFIVSLMRMLLKSSRVIFATMRDFFKSTI